MTRRICSWHARGVGVWLGSVVLFFPLAASASQRSISLQMGPGYILDIGTGFFSKLTGGYALDEMVDVHLATFFYRKSKTEENVSDSVELEGGPRVWKSQITKKIGNTMVPALAEVTVRVPVAGQRLFPTLNAGAGYNFYWRTMLRANAGDTAILSVKHEKEYGGLYAGFIWCLGAGADYRLGSRSFLQAQLLYHNSEVENANHYKTRLDGVELTLGLWVQW